MTAMLMPPPRGHCLICARKHDADEPHDGQSVYYGMRFQAEHRRAPTWYDAVAHLSEDLQAMALEVARELYVEHGLTFNELPEGATAIAEPHCTHEDRPAVGPVSINLHPVEIAMDGSRVAFTLNVGKRSLDAVHREFEQQLRAGGVTLSKSKAAPLEVLAKIQAQGIKAVRITWEKKTGEITAEPVKE